MGRAKKKHSRKAAVRASRAHRARREATLHAPLMRLATASSPAPHCQGTVHRFQPTTPLQGDYGAAVDATIHSTRDALLLATERSIQPAKEDLFCDGRAR